MRFLLTTVHLVIIVLLLGTLLNAIIPPSTLLFLDALSLSFPVLMILNILLIIIWILGKRKRALFFIALSLLLFNPTRRWINFSSKKPEGSIKVVSINGHQDDKGQILFDYIDTQNADVVLMQETNFKSGDSLHVRNEAVLATRTKHKILSHKNLDIGNGNSQAFATDIDINGKTIRFINVYLEPFYFNKDLVKGSAEDENKMRTVLKRLFSTFKFHEEQVKIISDAAKNSPYPVIIGGDFNSVPNSFEYYTVAENMKDGFLEAGRGLSTSFHDYKFPIRIDYFFTSKNISTKTYKVDRSVKISDHFPVIATFDFN